MRKAASSLAAISQAAGIVCFGLAKTPLLAMLRFETVLFGPPVILKIENVFQDRLGTNAQTQGKHPTKGPCFWWAATPVSLGAAAFTTQVPPVSCIESMNESAPIRFLHGAHVCDSLLINSHWRWLPQAMVRTTWRSEAPTLVWSRRWGTRWPTCPGWSGRSSRCGCLRRQAPGCRSSLRQRPSRWWRGCCFRCAARQSRRVTFSPDAAAAALPN